MKIKYSRLLAVSIYCLALIVIIPACSSDDDGGVVVQPPMNNNELDCPSSVSYSNDILPIINNTCALSGCHVAGFSSGNFLEFDPLKDRASSGALASRVGNGSMPPASSTGPDPTDEERELILCWVEAGAPNN